MPARLFADLLLLICAVVPATGMAACPPDREPEHLADRLDLAERSYADLDVEGFVQGMEDAAFLVPCLGAPVSPRLAARYHRLQGLHLFVARDEERAAQSFAASRFLAPRERLPPSLAPSGHEVHDLFERIDLASGEVVEVARPASGWLLFDGHETLERPSGWPTMAQVVDDDGEVVDTAYVFPGEALPRYTVAPGATEQGQRRRGRTRQVLWGTTAVSAIGSAFLYGLAYASSESFWRDHPDYTTSDLAAHRARTNGLVIGSAGAAVLAVGTGVGGLFVVGR